MLKLPFADVAIVEPAKVRDYLLSAEHPIGRTKAGFFNGLGFDRNNWELLQTALIDIAKNGDAELASLTSYGQKYLVSGMMSGTTGKSASVVTIWILPTGDTRPKLVTAYPGDMA